MRTIVNEYKIEDSKISIEHDLIYNDYCFRIIDLKTFVCRYGSAPISNLVDCRAQAFQYMGIQSKS
jgi:hypothetical protein